MYGIRPLIYLILLVCNRAVSLIIDQTHIQKCQLDSNFSCHFPRLYITEGHPHFQPIADNIDIITTVSFKQSLVPIITEDVFNAFPNLQTYNGESTSCRAIAEGAFINATNLEIVRLSENNFTEIKAFSFTGATNITSVSFKYNQVVRIDENAFSNLLELESLDLGHNLLVTVPATTFHNNRKLKVLYLNGNLLEYIEPGLFDNLTELRWLSLSVNRLRAFPVTHLVNSANLEILWLYSNHLSDLNAEKMVKHFRRLTKCHINDNYFRCDRLEEILSVFHLHHVNETMNPYSIPRPRPYITRKLNFDAHSSVDCITEEQYFLEGTTPMKKELISRFIFGSIILTTIICVIICMNGIIFIVVRRHIKMLDKKIESLTHKMAYLPNNTDDKTDERDKTFRKSNNNEDKRGSTEIIYAKYDSLRGSSNESVYEIAAQNDLPDPFVYRTANNNVSIRDISKEGEDLEPIIVTVKTETEDSTYKMPMRSLF